jgi:antitoxin MazE
MVTRLIKIGNSRGIRLPKAIIEQAGLKDEVNVTVREGQIILAPVEENPRAGWEEAIRRAVAAHGDSLVDEEFLSMPDDLRDEDWTW